MTKPRRTLDELPGLAERGGYVYALLFGTGIVRVGRTDDARTDVTALRSEARAFGADLADWWVSVPHVEWVANERALIECCRVLGGRRTGPGCYADADFGLLTGKAHDLPFTKTDSAGPLRRRRREHEDPDRRMAVTVRFRSQGMSVRNIATRRGVSHTTVVRDLARWERVRDEMPLEIIRLSRSAGTSQRNTGAENSTSSDTAVPGSRSSEPGVIPLRRLA